MNSHELKHALSALISVIVSTQEGVTYITHTAPGKQSLLIVEKIIDILREQEDGSVTQRFNVAILQKISAQSNGQLEDTITEAVIDLMTKRGMIHWCL